MKAPVFADTSALAKWYLTEQYSEQFAELMMQAGGATISRLAVAEMDSLLSRRLRAKEISPRMHRDVIQAFHQDMRLGFIQVVPLQDAHVLGATEILRSLQSLPIRTLDALQIAVALDLPSHVLATADRGMTRAARKLGIRVATFY